MKIPNSLNDGAESDLSLARIVSEDSQRWFSDRRKLHKSSKDS